MLVCLIALPAGADTPAGITLVPQDGGNFTLTELISPTYAVLAVSPPTHGWFAGTFTHLPTTAPVTLGFPMDGNDDPKTPGDVSKWVGLRPVMTYADPTQYASYVSYHQDDAGQWLSDDPFCPATERSAGIAAVPQQTVMPATDAAAFLSADGNTWSPWREIDQAQTLPKVNVFRMTQQFTPAHRDGGHASAVYLHVSPGVSGATRCREAARCHPGYRRHNTGGAGLNRDPIGAARRGHGTGGSPDHPGVCP